MIESPSDAELLARVRSGDRLAYDSLWRRHVKAGYRYANHYLPRRADDLVSEAFLAIYQTITNSDGGPSFAFRSYLKTVIRNTAIKWQRESARLIDSDFQDESEGSELVDRRDPLAIVEAEGATSELAAAFRDLPDRWQRVLWLAEIAQVDRSGIARELGIRPNAVSALQRRARSGLKLQWFRRQVPEQLRDDSDHVARLLPEFLTESENARLAAVIQDHVVHCATCEDLLQSMRVASDRLQSTTLVVLLGSAGASVSSIASTVTAGSATAATVFSAGAAVGGWLAAGGVSLLLLAGAAPLLPAAQAPVPTKSAAAYEPLSPTPTVEETDARFRLPSTPASSAPPINATAPTEDVLPRPTPPVGRGVVDSSIPAITFEHDQPEPVASPPAGQPVRANPATPSPSVGNTGLDSPSVSTPSDSSAYLAPVIKGQASGGTTLALEVGGQRYTVETADGGEWSFDARAFRLPAGEHHYRVWAFHDDQTSAAVEGSFTILPIEVKGFEEIAGNVEMTLDEVRSTGIVVEIFGPPFGEVRISTELTGLSAIISLGSDGRARKRIVMRSHGWYYFTFQALESGYLGPRYEQSVDVYDSNVIFDPWSSDPDQLTFEVLDP